MVQTAHDETPEVSSVAELEACLRDLLALLALPALWAGREPRAILELLFDALASMLSYDFAHAHLKDRWEPLEVVRLGEGTHVEIDDLQRATECCFAEAAAARMTIEVGGHRHKVVVMPLGFHAERGGIILGARRESFPTATERLLLHSAMTLASTAIETARALREREEASRAKDEFLAMLGHELRNPLAPIVTAIQLMKLRGAGDATREQEIIERQAGHLVRLVDDLLDISRVTRGKVRLKPESLEIGGVIAKAIETASPLLEQRRHHLIVSAPKRGLTVRGDGMRLTQIVANLLTNAAKYTDPGGHIELDAHRDGDAVVIRVKDDGIGIHPDVLPHVFDLFVQGKATIHRTEGGLGLGLALVKNLATLHGGSAEAHSDGPGHGSEFVVRLPALPGEARSERFPRLSTPPPLATEPLHVLIVDDNVDAAMLLAEILHTVGHRVRVAHDGANALSLVEQDLPDVMIIDIGLPVMDGYELAARLQEQLGRDTPRLLALTGYGQDHDIARSKRAGFALHLVKPIDAHALLSAVTSCV